MSHLPKVREFQRGKVGIRTQALQSGICDPRRLLDGKEVRRRAVAGCVWAPAHEGATASERTAPSRQLVWQFVVKVTHDLLLGGCHRWVSFTLGCVRPA